MMICCAKKLGLVVMLELHLQTRQSRDYLGPCSESCSIHLKCSVSCAIDVLVHTLQPISQLDHAMVHADTPYIDDNASLLKPMLLPLSLLLQAL